MTKEEVINKLNSLKQYYNDDYDDDEVYVGFDAEDNEAIDMAIKALEQTELTPSYNGVKSELEQTRWIPCSEKMPDVNIHVLAQFVMGGMAECYFAHNWWHIVGGFRISGDEVIAWIPLPEAYKAESEDEE